MKAPAYSSSVKNVEEVDLNRISDNSRSISKTVFEEQATTSNLLKWISVLTDKRRQFRKKYRSSNLLAETVLTNALKMVKSDLSKKQEEKKNRLKQFSIQLQSDLEARQFLCKENYTMDYDTVDDTVKSSLQSLDSFFNNLTQGSISA